MEHQEEREQRARQRDHGWRERRRGMCANSSTAPGRGLLALGRIGHVFAARRSLAQACSNPEFPLCAEHVGAPPLVISAWRWWRWRRRSGLPPEGEDPGRGVRAADGGGDRGRRRRAVRRAGSGDALGLDVDPEVPPRGLRHRAQQLSGGESASARRAASSTPPRRRRRASCSRGRGAGAAADASSAGGAGRPIETAPTDGSAAAVLASGARGRASRGKNGGWGFAGLGKRAEEDKNRAWHDLEQVRASAADYERAAARAGK